MRFKDRGDGGSVFGGFTVERRNSALELDAQRAAREQSRLERRAEARVGLARERRAYERRETVADGAEFNADLGPVDQELDRNTVALRVGGPGAGGRRVRARVGVLLDPSFKLAPREREAGLRLAELHQAAERIGDLRGCLAGLDGAGGGRSAGGPDLAKAERAVAARAAFERFAALVPCWPCVETPAGRLSEWDVIEALALRERRLVDVAGDGRRRQRAVREAFARGLARVAEGMRL